MYIFQNHGTVLGGELINLQITSHAAVPLPRRINAHAVHSLGFERSRRNDREEL